jgi:hypothetical protein
MFGAVTHQAGMCGLVSLRNQAIVKNMTGRSTRVPCLRLRHPCSTLNHSMHRRLPRRRLRRSMRIHTQHRILYLYRTRIIPIRPGTHDTTADLDYTWDCLHLCLTFDLGTGTGDTSAGIVGAKCSGLTAKLVSLLTSRRHRTLSVIKAPHHNFYRDDSVARL